MHQPVEVEWEEWRDVVGRESQYQISDHGRLRSLARWVRASHGSTQFRPGGIRKTFVCKTNGYRSVVLTDGPIKKNITLHKMVHEAFIGPIDNGLHIRHLDGNRINNMPHNLKVGTPAENWADTVVHGTSCSGENARAAKLTWEEAEAIRNMPRKNRRAIADRFGVAPRAIRNIQNGKTWKKERAPRNPVYSLSG